MDIASWAALITGVTAFLGFIVQTYRMWRRDREHDVWRDVDGALAQSDETVDATLARQRAFVESTAAERTQLEQALSEERRRRAALEAELVELQAHIAKQDIKAANLIKENAQLNSRIERLLAGDMPPYHDLRPPHLDVDEED